MICQRTQRLFFKHINIVIPLNSGLHRNCENHCTEHRCTPTLAPPTSTCYLSRTMLTATYHETHKVLGIKKKKPSQTQNKSNTQTLKWPKGLTANVPWHSQRCHILALKGQRWHEEDLHDIRQLVWMLWLISLSNCNFVATVSTLLANWPSGQRLTFFLHKFQNFLRGPADFFCVKIFLVQPHFKILAEWERIWQSLV